MPAVQSKSSSSKAQSARPATEDVLKIPRNWHVPFVSFLEVQQASWDKIDRLPDPGPERQSFLRQQRDALVEWAELEELQDHLPERASLKNVSSFTIQNMYTVVTGSQGPSLIFRQ